MATISQLRQKYPQYEDMSDQKLADAFHSKYYSDLPKEEFYKKLEFTPDKSAVPADGRNSGGDGPKPSASVPVEEKTLGNTFLSGIKAAGAGAIGTLAEIVDPTPMWGLERVGSPVVPDLSKTKNAAAQVVDKQREQYADGLVGKGLGYTTEVVANPVNFLGARGAGIAKEAGSAVTGLLSRPVARAGQGFVSGYLQGVGEEDSRLTNAGYGAVGSAALSGFGSAARGTARAVIPQVSENIAPLAKRAKELGIDLSISQVAPSGPRNTVQKVSQELPFSGTGKFADRQRTQFNNAVAKTIGEETLSPESVNNYLQRAKNDYDSVLVGKEIKPTTDDIGTIKTLVESAKDAIDPNLAGIVERNANKLVKAFEEGSLTGEKLASMRSEILKNAVSGKNAAGEYLHDLVGSIDDVAKRFLNKEETSKWANANRQYRNFKTIEPLLEGATNGEINPTQLLQKVQSSKYIKASRTETGKDNLVDLARIGKEFLPRLGGSDTAQKTALIASGAGGLYGLLNPVFGAKVAGTLAANRAFQSLYNQSPKLVERAVNKGLSADVISKAKTPRELEALIMGETFALKNQMNESNRIKFGTGTSSGKVAK